MPWYVYVLKLTTTVTKVQQVTSFPIFGTDENT